MNNFAAYGAGVARFSMWIPVLYYGYGAIVIAYRMGNSQLWSHDEEVIMEIA